jgi:hypothetical protein
MADSARRAIFFFTTQLFDRNKKPVADQGEFLKALSRLPLVAESTPPERHRTRTIDKHVFEALEVSPARDGSFEGRFFRTRESDLPTLGAMRRDAADQVLPLPPGYGLRHSAHFVWIDLARLPEFRGHPARQEGLIVAEFNRDAPRLSSVGQYVYDIFDGAYRLSVQPLVRDDVFETLRRRGNLVKSTTVRMPFERAKDGGLGGLWVPSAKKSIGKVIVKTRARRGGYIDLTPDIPRLKKRMSESPEDEDIIFDENQDTMLDLFGSVLKIRGAEVPFVQGSKAVSTPAMIRELRNVLNENRGDVIASLGRVPDSGTE